MSNTSAVAKYQSDKKKTVLYLTNEEKDLWYKEAKKRKMTMRGFITSAVNAYIDSEKERVCDTPAEKSVKVITDDEMSPIAKERQKKIIREQEQKEILLRAYEEEKRKGRILIDLSESVNNPSDVSSGK